MNQIIIFSQPALLQMYVSREPVSQSSSEAEKSPIILKQLTFGRLPQCLCLHVQVNGENPIFTVPTDVKLTIRLGFVKRAPCLPDVSMRYYLV